MSITEDLDAAAFGAADDQTCAVQRRDAAGGAQTDITPTSLHYVRSNFAVPAHDGNLEIGGAVDRPVHPDARRPARPAGRAAGRHPGMRGQRTARHAAAARRRAVGQLRGVDRPLDRHPTARRAATGEPGGGRGRGPLRRPDHGPYLLRPVLPESDRRDLAFTRSLPFAYAADPANDILIAYEMNGEPLNPDHGAPFRLITPRWFAVASVKWLRRITVLTEPYAGEFQTGH